MTARSRFAAQYIRMSTDKQDLSPKVQKEAIAAYAAARGMEVVASYEDEGRSGVHLKNRVGLLSLLRDVTQQPAQFSTVLVYDVSRWGRFQDADAAAYHEYHCRLHGVEVIYVAEMFGSEVNPITALLKSMKRAMAAEYSLDLAKKCRAGQNHVVARGNQMGALPALGFRRCSVSAQGGRRVPLDLAQRKLAATDRIEWVAAPQSEVDLVRRICEMYARTRLTFNDIARLGEAEGWRDHRGRRISGRAVARLLGNEALIGNFVWGRERRGKALVHCAPARHEGSVPRIIDDELWAEVQRRRLREAFKKQTDDQIAEKLSEVLRKSPLLTERELRAHGLPGKRTVKNRLGAWSDCLSRAGVDPAELSRKLSDRSNERREHGQVFGIALIARLREIGLPAEFDGRVHVLSFGDVHIRLRLLWPTSGEAGTLWRIRPNGAGQDVDFDLLVRMEAPFRAKDFFVASSADVIARFPHWVPDQVPAELDRFRLGQPEDLIGRLRAISAMEASISVS